MDIEQRLKDHLAESGRRIGIEPDNPSVVMDPTPPRSGKVVQFMTAVLLVAVAGAGFWMLSDDDGGTTEIAAGEAEDTDDGAADDGDESSGDTSGESDSGTGSGDGGTAGSADLDFTDITSDLSPSGNGPVVVENDVYYFLSTAPGRVRFDWETGSDEEFFELMRPNTFYIFQESSGWEVTTIEDRFVSDFDVREGVLYVVSTGGVATDQAAVGTSTDRGRSWDWQNMDGLPKVDQVHILATDDQPLVFASRWGYADFEQATELAATAGIELFPMSLYNVDGNGFTYVPLDGDDRCDFVLGQLLPMVIEMDLYRSEYGEEMSDAEFEQIRADELGWVTEEIEANGCSVPDNVDQLTIGDLPELPEPVTKTWEGLGIEVPEEWSPWAGLFRFDGANLQELDLPFGPNQQAGFVQARDRQLVISVYDEFDYNTEVIEEPDGETAFITSDGETWREEFHPYPQSDDDVFEPWWYNDGGYMAPVVGDRGFRIWYDEMAFEENAPEEEWVEPTPDLQTRVGDGPWESVSPGDIVDGTDIGDRHLWDVRGSSLGVFVTFGPRWDPVTGEPAEDTSITFYTANGVDWQPFDVAGQHIHFVGNGNEMLLFSTDWQHEDGHYSVTESYLVRPKG
ncbi:MAG: hypothetical protein AAF531_00135 [Actinomycetota bacterium]